VHPSSRAINARAIREMSATQIAHILNLESNSMSMMETLGVISPFGPSEERSAWSYAEAFKRNRGLISEAEQQKLRRSRVAIAGIGGVGGLHLMTLARMGVGNFTIADPDIFEVANFNRQYGATLSTLGVNKAEVIAEAALDVNPELGLKVFPAAIDETNIDRFLAGADVFVDGLDFFAIEARRLIFRRAAERGLWAITAGPIGLSAGWVVFDPDGMPFDRYFDLHDGQDRIDQLVAFAAGLTPKATHRIYTDLAQVDMNAGAGPSISAACQLASGVACIEAAKVLLGRGRIRPAPSYAQFDAYHGALKTGCLRLGNRDPRQRLKRGLLKRHLKRLGVCPNE